MTISGVVIEDGDQAGRIYAKCLSYSSTFKLAKECERRGFGMAQPIADLEQSGLADAPWASNIKPKRRTKPHEHRERRR